jgi:predicted acylesterase/phospholipase RssA
MSPLPLGEAPAPEASADVRREVRFALVMNGGVSLAVWMGGVTHEIDRVRRARPRYRSGDAEDDAAASPRTPYDDLLSILKQEVVVDVIAGASAGGINGTLLAAAIYAGKPLPDLRGVWITVGDFERLLRPPGRPHPPSILRGDEVVFGTLERTFTRLLRGTPRGPDHSLDLYVTGTNFGGVPRIFADSTRRRFRELDHRHLFHFEHREPAAIEQLVHNLTQELRQGAPDSTSAMPDVASFAAPDVARLLAHAARASSSFPVAFEAHGIEFAEDPTTRWFIDGGVLDNQPFGPVLDRIATVVGGRREIRRVVAYVVPYVTEADAGPASPGRTGSPERRDPPPQPTAVQTASAATSLPRDIPKLLDLVRIAKEKDDADRAGSARTRLEALKKRGELASAARSLFESYRETREEECLRTFRHWASPDFRPGAGEIGQLQTVEPDDALADAVPGRPSGTSRTSAWVPSSRRFLPAKDGQLHRSGASSPGDGDGASDDPADTEWRWGLSPSERIAREVLRRLRTLQLERPGDERIALAAATASALVADVRRFNYVAALLFREAKGTLYERADAAYEGTTAELTKRFAALHSQLGDTPGAPPLQEVIDAEVIQNALAIGASTTTSQFHFLHASAGIRNALDHPCDSPSTKLAGMKLAHFAGFLKRSWRANDWMWGRLDGAQYIVKALIDQLYLRQLVQGDEGVCDQLTSFAFPAQSKAVLAEAWEVTLRLAAAGVSDAPVRNAIGEAVSDVAGLTAEEQFRSLLKKSAEKAGDAGVKAQLLDCCRTAIAARIQLEFLGDELREVANATADDDAHGANRSSSGRDWAVRGIGDSASAQVARFHALQIAREESPADEGSSRLGMNVIATGVAVTAAAFSGSRGGAPGLVRAGLASVRAITLVVQIMVRLLTRTPAVGLAALIVIGIALVWAFESPSTTLSAAVPALIVVAVAAIAVLLTMLTSPLERPCRGWKQGISLLAMIAAPVLTLAFVLGLPFTATGPLPLNVPFTGYGGGELADRIADSTADWAVDIAATASIIAALAALARIVLGATTRTRVTSHKARATTLWAYRWAWLVAGALLAAGAVYQHVSESDHSWNVTVMLLLLVAAISLAPLVAELTSGAIAAMRWLWHDEYPWTTVKRVDEEPRADA